MSWLLLTLHKKLGDTPARYSIEKTNREKSAIGKCVLANRVSVWS